MIKNHLNRVALLIGISEYDSPFNSLPQVKNNIRDLHEILSNPHLGGYTIDDKYRNENSIAKDLENTIHEFIENNEGKSVLIYYAGHGLVGPNNIFLLTARDSKINENGTFKHATFVTSTSIIDCIRVNNFKELVLILDCCYAGAFIEDFKNSVEKNPTLQKRNYTIIASCNASSKVYLQKNSDHSPFVESFIERINNKEDRGKRNSISINANDLFNYTSKHTDYLKPQKLVSESSENSPPIISNIKTNNIEAEIFRDKISVNENHKKSEDVKKLFTRYNKVKKLFKEESELDVYLGSDVQNMSEKERKGEGIRLQKILNRIAIQKNFNSENERKTFTKEISKELELEATNPFILSKYILSLFKNPPKGEINYNALRSISLIPFSVIFFSGKEVLAPQIQPHIYYNKLSSKKVIFNNTSVLSVSVSPDSRNMVILSRDGKLKKLNLDNGFPRDLPGEKIKLAFYTSSGKTQAISTDKTNIKINRSNEKNPLPIPLKGNADDYIFSADDKTLVAISKTSRTIEAFSLATGKREMKENFLTEIPIINNVIIKNEFIIIAGEKRLDETCEKNNDDDCSDEAYLGKGSIEIFNWKKNQLIIKNNDHSNEVTAMAISGNGNILISSSAAAGQLGGEIRVWNLARSIKSKKLIPKFEGVQSTNAALSGIATNHEGDTMAVSSAEDKIQIRLTSSKDGNKEIIDNDSNQINPLAFNLKGDMLFSSDLTGRIIQYNLDKN
jgi:Caspase domain